MSTQAEQEVTIVEQETAKTRLDWERELVAFLAAPKAPTPKGARVKRLSPRRAPARCAQTA